MCVCALVGGLSFDALSAAAAGVGSKRGKASVRVSGDVVRVDEATFTATGVLLSIGLLSSLDQLDK